MANIGEHYGKLFRDELNKTVQTKFDETAGWKKTVAGISTLDDAKNKGYAPKDAQVNAVVDLVRNTANEMYADPEFLKLPADKAAKQLANTVTEEVKKLNDSWKKQGQFAFKPDDLKKLEIKSAEVINKEHAGQVKIALENLAGKTKQAAATAPPDALSNLSGGLSAANDESLGELFVTVPNIQSTNTLAI